ncbi:recombinase family protein [Enterobacter roggenkampii]|uniref:recombinase zinc beta ribbon domain-containing protein n=1 Tax=Enterobacter roggenkampii TaxID=1812935 RepID=UPI0022326396|nr:recombinase family protein [Enterobacter roggenkampii]MDM9075505.1 recombinase family protein [Enterobacter roggenkampii]
MKKAVYCYARVSSRGQAKDGYGMSRQQTMLRDYVAAYDDSQHSRGCELGDITWLYAEGVSAYSGKNIEDGSVLKTFIDDVLQKKITNSVLVIENLDRFSRAAPNRAAGLFLSLINAGCDIHEVETEMIHHQYSDLNIISGGLQRAHNESKRKARLSIKNWDERIKNTIDGTSVLTHRVPSWIEVKNNKYVIKKGESEKYNLIFKMYADGFWPAAIRDELKNRRMQINEREPTIHHLMKIIKDKRLIGRFNSTGRKVLDGMPIYPVVVEPELFELVNDLRKQRNPLGKINVKANNLFAGLCICMNCGRYVQINSVDKKGNTYFRCGGSLVKIDKCKERGFKYKIVENALLEHLRNFDFSMLRREDNEIQVKINYLSMELVSNENYSNEILADLEKEDIPDPHDRRILKNIQRRISEIRTEITTLKQSNIGYETFNDLKDSYTDDLLDPKNTKLRLDFNVKVKRVIKNIKMKRYDDTIMLVVSYVGVNEKQAMVINSKTGEVVFMAVQNDDLKSIEYLINND